MLNKTIKCISVILSILLLLTSKGYADTPLVVLDAGHGGIDSGAISPDGQFIEKIWNLETTESCKKTLEKYDVDVILTREGDIFLSLAERKQIANSADVSVSIHYNATKNHKGAYGLIIGGNVEGSTELAHSIRDELLKVRDNVQVWEDNSYYAMTNLKVPCVIVETTFIDNPNDSKYADTLKERQIIGERIAYGILNYLGVDTSQTDLTKDISQVNKTDKVNKVDVKKSLSIIDRIKNRFKSARSNNKVQYIRDLILN